MKAMVLFSGGVDSTTCLGIAVDKYGAENERKTALYLSLETLRKELIEMENIFGLTPKGLKAIKTKGLESKKESAIDAALRKMSG